MKQYILAAVTIGLAAMARAQVNPNPAYSEPRRAVTKNDYYTPSTLTPTMEQMAAEGYHNSDPSAARPTVNDAEAAEILKTMDAATAKAKADYDRAVAVAMNDALAKLKVRMDALTKSAALDDAVTVRDLIAFIKKYVPIEESTARVLNLRGGGEVSIGSNGYTFHSDGNFAMGSKTGTWKISDNRLTLTWTVNRGDPFFGRVDIVPIKEVVTPHF